MFDQLVIGANRSYDDFEASVKERKITDGAKKTIKETVPFSNEVYDFSKIDGELYWGEKTLQYIFEITAHNPEELSAKITKFKSWVMNIMDGELHDPFIVNYHFIATFSAIDVNETEFEKATITVTFTAYPYMVSNVPKVYGFALAGAEMTTSITNNSSHRIVPTFNADIPFTIKVGGAEYGVPSGETKDEYFKLEPGIVEFTLNATESGTVTITFHEEVF